MPSASIDDSLAPFPPPTHCLSLTVDFRPKLSTNHFFRTSPRNCAINIESPVFVVPVSDSKVHIGQTTGNQQLSTVPAPASLRMFPFHRPPLPPPPWSFRLLGRCRRPKLLCWRPFRTTSSGCRCSLRRHPPLERRRTFLPERGTWGGRRRAICSGSSRTFSKR